MLVVAEALERGAWQGRAGGPVLRAMSSLWARAAAPSIVRRLVWPERVRVVAVGGATLGGSGKTPVAMACAAHVAAAGARTALVGHAYRARPGRARWVAPDDRVDEVGDEALLAARVLGTTGARVAVAPTRREAIAFAARWAEVLVLDGIAQTTPVRASIALLAVDAAEPWGAGAVPPCGDLRAERAALLAACDLVVPVDDGSTPCDSRSRRGPIHLEGADPARVDARGAWVDEGALLTWPALRRMRVGVVLALARPGRVLRSLASRGVLPRVVVRARDHGPLAGRSRRELARASQDVDLWLATPKCALHLPVAALADGRLPVATLDHRVILPAALCSRLDRLAVP